MTTRPLHQYRTQTSGNSDRDLKLNKYRHLVENLLARLEQFRAIAFHDDKLKRNFESVIYSFMVTYLKRHRP